MVGRVSRWPDVSGGRVFSVACSPIAADDRRVYMVLTPFAESTEARRLVSQHVIRHVVSFVAKRLE
jgi:hypothetical protein